MLICTTVSAVLVDGDGRSVWSITRNGREVVGRCIDGYVTRRTMASEQEARGLYEWAIAETIRRNPGLAVYVPQN